MAYRYGKKVTKQNTWWSGDIEGTEEEQVDAAEYQKNYLYKLLDYAEKDEVPTPEEMKEMRRVYQYARQGPRAWHHRLNKKNILTSADVLYILTSSMSSLRLSKALGIGDGRIREIRRGEIPCWEWEYDLIRRLKAILINKLKHKAYETRKVYILSKLKSPGVYEEMYYATSRRKLEKLREDIIPKKEYDSLIKQNLLEEVYQIKYDELL